MVIFVKLTDEDFVDLALFFLNLFYFSVKRKEILKQLQGPMDSDAKRPNRCLNYTWGYR